MQVARGFSRVVPGVAVAIVLALLARLIADSVSHGTIGLPPISLSPVLFAVLIGMLWRNTVGVPSWTTEGLQWAMHSLLRTGIALVGLRLTLSGAGSIAITALPISLACLATGLAMLVAMTTRRMTGVGYWKAVLHLFSRRLRT